MPTPFAALILAAGKGTRMRSNRPKVLAPLAGRPLIQHVLAAVNALRPKRVLTVIGPGMEELAAAVAPAETVIQAQPRGTGHAVLAAKSKLGSFAGDVIVVPGDAPLLTRETLNLLLTDRRQYPEAALTVLGMWLPDAGRYGRIVLGPGNVLERIVEASDANEEERALRFANTGILIANAKLLFELSAGLSAENAQREYYLTDIVKLARERGLVCRAVEAPADDAAGVNSPEELAKAEALMQMRLRARAVASGAILLAADTVYFSADTKIGAGSIVGPFVVFGPEVKIGANVTIPAFCHIVGATIGDNSIVGPFARLRPGTALAESVHIGNFVEVKNARLAKGVKANHLAYLGDVAVGEGSNIGAGSITCNYDGIEKHRTNIGKGVFIGTNVSLVAPVNIGQGAILAAGSTITDNVPADALAFGRARQKTQLGEAKKWRARRKTELAGAGKKPAKKSKSKSKQKKGRR
jgi:bifunctional UDP-N-acetylglucosamine pyrophosphorylase/glucosamine-1-phosphate N-acetyltransferase